MLRFGPSLPRDMLATHIRLFEIITSLDILEKDVRLSREQAVAFLVQVCINNQLQAVIKIVAINDRLGFSCLWFKKLTLFCVLVYANGILTALVKNICCQRYICKKSTNISSIHFYHPDLFNTRCLYQSYSVGKMHNQMMQWSNDT